MLFDKGVYTVIPTPFYYDSDNNIGVDLDSLYKIVDRQLISHNENSIKGIILFGSTSEVSTLTKEEREAILSNVAYKYIDKINIIAGIGGNDTYEVVREGYRLKDFCHGFMIDIPYYNKPSQENIYHHISYIAKKFEDRELIINNTPDITGIDIDTETIINLSNENFNISAFKDSSKNYDKIYNIKKNTGLKIYCGDDTAILQYSISGSYGVISVASNIRPKIILEIVNFCNKNDYESANKLFPILYDLNKILFIKTNPIPLKILLSRYGLCNDIVRLPLVLPNEEIIKTIKRKYTPLDDQV